ncbi:LPXTG cell wall anchor domain-containing protein [uncultured Aeromicrobium sp.]
MPKTGSPVGPIVGLGAALLVAAGLTALVLARRREENEV